MEDKIFRSIILRPGMEGKEDLILDIIADAIDEVRLYINYNVDEEIPMSLKGTVQNIVLSKFNRIGAEGLNSEGYSGISQNYIDGLSSDDKTKLRKHRRLSR